MNYKAFLSDISKRRQGSILRELTKEIAFSVGEVYPLSGGIPTPAIFPFKNSTFTLKDGTSIYLNENEMESAQQYGVTEGFEPLREILRDYQIRLHDPPNTNWTIVTTSGAQEAICLSFELLLNEGDYVIGGDHCFSGTLDIFRPLGAKYIAVDQDEHGMIPDSLRRQLRAFDPNLQKLIKLIYIVPNGGNPEAYTLLTSRRQEIYQIAQEYNLLILEDDPYQFIVFDQPKLPRSFLSMDVDGRVIRCDTFSKTISPGLRLGYITAPKQLAEIIVYKIQVSSQQASCLSQLVTYKLLSLWGFDGYIENSKRICNEFKKQKDIAKTMADKHLKNVASWEQPSGGMFLWIKVKDVSDSAEIVELARKRGAFFAPGRAFRYDHSPSPYIRVSFSNATAHTMDEGFKVLGECIAQFKHTNVVPKPNGVANGVKNGCMKNGTGETNGNSVMLVF